MAQHKVGERVKPEDVLRCVKKHRLFPQAEASVRLRIPDIQKFLHLGTEGPNPYAAMAVILILSESVGDVQSLVSLLSSCMSVTAITEYLSHMAMMLLALERNKIKISYRLHYNIYYVLYLLENGPFCVNSGQNGFPDLYISVFCDRLPQIHLTREQQEILSHNIQDDHVVKIVAFAAYIHGNSLSSLYPERKPCFVMRCQLDPPPQTRPIPEANPAAAVFCSTSSLLNPLSLGMSCSSPLPTSSTAASVFEISSIFATSPSLSVLVADSVGSSHVLTVCTQRSTSSRYFAFPISIFASDPGTGKTTTLVKYAALRPDLRFLYVAFNNSVACEARRRFPANVDCRTAHSLAYNDVGRRYKDHKKLTFNVKPFSINFALPTGAAGFCRAKVVTTILNAFMASADQTIDSQHVPFDYVINKGCRKIIEPEEQKVEIFTILLTCFVIKFVMRLHTRYCRFTLMRCFLCKSTCFLLCSQELCSSFQPSWTFCCPRAVGRSWWETPTNRSIPLKEQSMLSTQFAILTSSTSLRFGAEIAFVGAAILKVCKGVHKILVGGMQKGGVCDETADKALEAMKKGVSCSRGKIGILSRCNLGVFKGAVQLTDANQQCQIHFIGVRVYLNAPVGKKIVDFPSCICNFFSCLAGCRKCWAGKDNGHLSPDDSGRTGIKKKR
ncbi:hypothetical protein GOODEAATRI_021185 [Goodea atripinnis]|uniref:DNA helicase n=1 Tax=Goodea atripinnis TaxID=208336 RepID=A0ABV0MJI8_9TELE